KPGLLLDPARSFVGDLILADIGITDDELAAQSTGFAALDEDELLALLPTRSPTADKRAAGAPFIIAGSQQFPGAAVLCARGAARAGAGYVTVATSAKGASTLRAHLVEQVVTEIADHSNVDDAIEALLDTAKHCSAIGIGPGLGLDGRTGEIVRGFLQQTDLPFVADASALFHFAKHLELLDTPRAVITPHAGEFARLSGRGTLHDEDRVARLRDFVERTHCTTLLKGRTTLIDDGKTLHLNLSGTAALATAGTGDVLTGIIATLLSQGLSPVDAARAGAYWHGLAALHCATTRRRGVIAGDLPEALSAALPTPRESTDLRLVFKA
ncbi:MAG: NAD(P)H-hydrate dehydratase, partial [Candidatus Eremiobacteraeota bacterium]|nr:NAD(P)H-hydrate dehydratase [Candidatus Eremiobacteraeota bacterium]